MALKISRQMGHHFFFAVMITDKDSHLRYDTSPLVEGITPLTAIGIVCVGRCLPCLPALLLDLHDQLVAISRLCLHRPVELISQGSKLLTRSRGGKFKSRIHRHQFIRQLPTV